jgi:hypothetical protein
MKTQQEIVIKAKAYAESIGNEDGTSAYDYVMGYTQCQEDMIKEIDNLKCQLRTYEAKEPKYAVEEDYCSVCGCTEFWNDEEEIN